MTVGGISEEKKIFFSPLLSDGEGGKGSL